MTGLIVTAYVGLGSNLESPLGDRARHLELASESLSEAGRVTKLSAVFETTPWGVEGNQPDYLNQVAALETDLDPAGLVSRMLGIESDLGRVRAERYGSRIIDLDVLLMGDTVIDETDVQVPHPRLHERAFVLVPLTLIAPDAIHPILGATMKELLARVDSSSVRPFTSSD